MPRITYKTYYRCSTELSVINGFFGAEIDILVNSYTFNGLLNPDGSYSAAPSWFLDFNFFPVGSCGWSMSPVSNDWTAGDNFKFSFTTANKDGTSTEYIVQVVVLDYCTVDIENAACANSPSLKVLTWLTREGGWAYFTFTGKTTFEVRIPEARTYKNADYIIRNNSRNDVYRGELITTGNIPQVALDLMESLKYSVQAYVIEDYTTEPRYVPILIQDGDFVKRKTGDKRFDVSVRFIYAEEIQIQSQ